MIVTHDPNIAFKVGRVVLIKDGKTSMEIRRTKYRGISGATNAHGQLDEFTLVDANGRLQIPSSMLSNIGIEERALVEEKDGKITISRISSE